MAFYSLLGIATGESWTGYVRNINVDNAEGIDASVAIFFVSFVGLVGIVAINVRVSTCELRSQSRFDAVDVVDFDRFGKIFVLNF